MNCQLVVRNKTRDPQAVTAHSTLVGRLGFGKSLASLMRGIYYELAIPTDDVKTTQRTVRRLLDESTLLANPNKEVAKAYIEPTSVEGKGLLVLVWDREGPRGDRLTRRIERELPEIGRVSVSEGVLWIPTFEGPESEWWKRAERMTVSTTRLSGLLVNPHAEHHRLFTGGIPHGFLHNEASERDQSASAER